MAYGTSNKYIVYSINTQQVTNDINTNATWLKVWIDIWRTNSGYSTYGTGTVYCRINGGLYSAGISTSQRITSTPIRIGEWDVTIPHQPDGTASISITAWFSHSQFSSSEQGFVLTLNTIPRVSSVSCSGGYFGSPLTINFDRKSDSFTHHLYYSINGGAEVGIGANYGTSTTWTPPLDLLNNVTNLDNAVIMFRAYTFNGGTNIGNTTCTCTVKVPENIVPSFESVTATGINLFNDNYLKNRSSCKLTINGATGIYGSTISSYKISGSYTGFGTSNEFTTSIFGTSGDKTFTATITDSRGRSVSKTCKINVKDYEPPSLIMDCYRCRKDGTRDDINGTYLFIRPTFTYTDDVEIGNSITTKRIVIDDEEQTGSVFTNFTSGQAIVTGTYALNRTFNVVVSVTDAVGNSSSATATIKVSAKPFNIKANKKGAAFGIYSTKDNTLEVGWDLQVDGNLQVAGDANIQGTLKATGDIYGGTNKDRKVAFADELPKFYVLNGTHIVNFANSNGTLLHTWAQIQEMFQAAYGFTPTKRTALSITVVNGDTNTTQTHIDGACWFPGDSSRDAGDVHVLTDQNHNGNVRINYGYVYCEAGGEID